jgi:hypothetical protein
MNQEAATFKEMRKRRHKRAGGGLNLARIGLGWYCTWLFLDNDRWDENLPRLIACRAASRMRSQSRIATS